MLWGHIHTYQDTSTLLVTPACGCSTHEILGSVAAPLVKEHNTIIEFRDNNPNHTRRETENNHVLLEYVRGLLGLGWLYSPLVLGLRVK